MPVEGIMYSDKYDDENFEYRHVTLPPDLAKLVPRNHLMTETEWRNLGRFSEENKIKYDMYAVTSSKMSY